MTTIQRLLEFKKDQIGLTLLAIDRIFHEIEQLEKEREIANILYFPTTQRK